MDINLTLEQSPSLKAKSAQEAEDLRLQWQQAKEAYNKEEAKRALFIKASNEKLTATQIKYQLLSDEKLYEDRLALTILESKYRKKEIETKQYDDLFTAAKSLARIKVAEMNTLDGWSATKKEG